MKEVCLAAWTFFEMSGEVIGRGCAGPLRKAAGKLSALELGKSIYWANARLSS